MFISKLDMNLGGFDDVYGVSGIAISELLEEIGEHCLIVPVNKRTMECIMEQNLSDEDYVRYINSDYSNIAKFEKSDLHKAIIEDVTRNGLSTNIIDYVDRIAQEMFNIKSTYSLDMMGVDYILTLEELLKDVTHRIGSRVKHNGQYIDIKLDNLVSYMYNFTDYDDYIACVSEDYDAHIKASMVDSSNTVPQMELINRLATSYDFSMVNNCYYIKVELIEKHMEKIAIQYNKIFDDNKEFGDLYNVALCKDYSDTLYKVLPKSDIMILLEDMGNEIKLREKDLSLFGRDKAYFKISDKDEVTIVFPYEVCD